MELAAHELPQTITEYHALMRHYGQTQARCDALVRAQAAQIARLEGQAMRLRAAVIVRDTALAWERTQRMEALVVCMQNLARERLQGQWRGARAAAEDAAGALAAEAAREEATGLTAANLVICQTGCLSHGDYWRVQDHCRRTGKTCVLVEQASGAHIAGWEPAAAPACLAPSLPTPENTLS
ncbi:DUF2325 domain-containing protein [Comamonas endophytica]|uniref:DUF2325 domain-containing protein n=1 Tax=Comamonas endophytica TaxID=2949090 RepID=A0ABY6G7J4_9BURK|nr:MULTISPECIES: DUF2325 domain-containing protein [unclassified Acidovorax]MCD2511630.1 DUF2325 domain-containing protein [Acidovorax sp. D4N7]UYG51012.1 DUF2325 domain-containing protein [Acidovorax sp. 5MLIR]